MLVWHLSEWPGANVIKLFTTAIYVAIRVILVKIIGKYATSGVNYA